METNITKEEEIHIDKKEKSDILPLISTGHNLGRGAFNSFKYIFKGSPANRKRKWLLVYIFNSSFTGKVLPTPNHLPLIVPHSETYCK